MVTSSSIKVSDYIDCIDIMTITRGRNLTHVVLVRVKVSGKQLGRKIVCIKILPLSHNTFSPVIEPE